MARRARPLVVLALVLACGGEAPPAADAGLDAAGLVDASLDARWTDFAATTFTLELFVRWTPDTHRYADIRILRMIGRWGLSLSREGHRFAGVDFPLDGSDVAGVPYHLDGRWHHLAVTVDGAAVTIALAVDGRPARTTRSRPSFTRVTTGLVRAREG